MQIGQVLLANVSSCRQSSAIVNSQLGSVNRTKPKTVCNLFADIAPFCTSSNPKGYGHAHVFKVDNRHMCKSVMCYFSGNPHTDIHNVNDNENDNENDNANDNVKSAGHFVTVTRTNNAQTVQNRKEVLPQCRWVYMCRTAHSSRAARNSWATRATRPDRTSRTSICVAAIRCAS